MVKLKCIFLKELDFESNFSEVYPRGPSVMENESVLVLLWWHQTLVLGIGLKNKDRFSVYSFEQLIGSDRIIETCGKTIIFHIIYNINI